MKCLHLRHFKQVANEAIASQNLPFPLCSLLSLCLFYHLCPSCFFGLLASVLSHLSHLFSSLLLPLFISFLLLFFYSYCSQRSVPKHFLSLLFSFCLSHCLACKHTCVFSPPLPSEEVLLFPGRLGGLLG